MTEQGLSCIEDPDERIAKAILKYVSVVGHLGPRIIA